MIEHEFPLSKKQVITGAVLALATAALGFVLNLPAVIQPATQPVLSKTDRHFAENGARPTAPSASGTLKGMTYLPPPAALPAGKTYLPYERSLVAIDYKTSVVVNKANSQAFASVAPSPKSRPSKKKAGPRLIKPASLFTAENKSTLARQSAPRKSLKKLRPAPPKMLPAKTAAITAPPVDNPDILTYPTLASRHSAMDWQAAWERGGRSNITNLDMRTRRIICSGLTLGNHNTIIGCNADSPWQATLSGHRLGNLGLLQNGDSGTAAILSPDPPDEESSLACAAGWRDEHVAHPGRVSRASHQGIFFAAAPCPPTANGGAVVNVRGEVAGVLIGALPGYPAHNFLACADSSVLDAVRKKHHLAWGNVNYKEAYCNVLESALDEVKGLSTPSKGRNSRIIPGVSLGRYHLGDTLEKVVKQLGPGCAFADCSDELYSLMRVYHENYGLEFTFFNNRLVCASVSDPSYATPTGVSPGLDWHNARLGPALKNNLQGIAENGETIIVGRGVEVILTRRKAIKAIQVTLL